MYNTGADIAMRAHTFAHTRNPSEKKRALSLAALIVRPCVLVQDCATLSCKMSGTDGKSSLSEFEHKPYE
jgi:hypothetical protein